MWMAYAEASDSKSEVVDLNSAVIRLQGTLDRLAFDADHEAVYGKERFYSTSECENLAENYNCAYNICERYLTSQINIDVLVHRLQELHLTRFIFDLENFLPSHLQKYLIRIATDDGNYDSGVEEAEEAEEKDDVDTVLRAVPEEGSEEEDGELKQRIYTNIKICTFLGSHIRDIQNKLCDPKAEPTIYNESISVAVVCGNNALGAVVGNYSMDLAMEKAYETGIGMVAANVKLEYTNKPAIVSSNNYGMASMYSLQAARKGYIGLSFSNCSPLMVPTNAKNVALGTNPLTIAAPGESCDVMVVDMSTTASAIGAIEIHRTRGSKIPEGWALNSEGKPETDPEKVLADPRLMPLGGKENHKGYGLALLVEVLSGLLAGIDFKSKFVTKQ
ncbi:hypothetical protein NQ314_009572 [Rhamnusium bicolor]|uniref:Uncharacterized protein n=1 Tax=Rhamnusium bicolor TaxID=1586634 RepID=A0AAV8XZ52_9CUCU|nr:hypothetical protein NQ314_009572 [Rhamnusium bicolor]